VALASKTRPRSLKKKLHEMDEQYLLKATLKENQYLTANGKTANRLSSP